jgi:hypothetical protein
MPTRLLLEVVYILAKFGHENNRKMATIAILVLVQYKYRYPIFKDKPGHV